MAAGVSSKVEIERQIIADDRVAAAFSAQVFRHGELLRRLDGIMFFQFAPDLLIRRMEVFIDM